MSAVSKEHFYRTMRKDFNCLLLHYWTPSCLQANIYCISQAFVGCTKFFLPIYVVKAIINRKNFKWKKILLEYARSCFYGMVFMSLFFGSNCLLYKLWGRLEYYNLGLAAGFLSGLSIFVESTFNRNLNTIYFFNCGVEAAIANLRFLGVLSKSHLQETVAFMILTSALMYLLRTQHCKPYNNLWFYPHRKSATAAGDSCNHNSCQEHALQGFFKYFLVGYGLEIVKFLMGNMGKLVKNPGLLLQGLFKRDNFKFGLVTGGFVALYRALICLLLKQEKKEKTYHHAIAGFLSGITYFIKPNIQFGITAFTTILQLLLQRFQRIHALPAESVVFLFALLNGILMHNRFMNVPTCPKYTVNMLRACSNGLDAQIFGPISKYIFRV